MTWPRRGSATTSPSARSRASAARTAALENPKPSTSCASDTSVPGPSSSATIAVRSRSYAAAPEVAPFTGQTAYRLTWQEFRYDISPAQGAWQPEVREHAAVAEPGDCREAVALER